MADPPPAEGAADPPAEGGDAAGDAAGGAAGDAAAVEDVPEVDIFGRTPRVTWAAYNRKGLEEEKAKEREQRSLNETHGRMWKLRLTNISITSKVDAIGYCFLKFVVGHDAQEYLVRMPDASAEVWTTGGEGAVFFVPDISLAEIGFVFTSEQVVWDHHVIE